MHSSLVCFLLQRLPIQCSSALQLRCQAVAYACLTWACLYFALWLAGLSNHIKLQAGDIQTRTGSNHHQARPGWQTLPVHPELVMPSGGLRIGVRQCAQAVTVFAEGAHGG
eukprot:GHRR01004176.1.p1 GENE.GHRR01004176.1~~GHRR01004176.1.p1  ORF type:complete len:111 (-),score=16.88 GHRR01004176.1:1143-1475(-)